MTYAKMDTSHDWLLILPLRYVANKNEGSNECSPKGIAWCFVSMDYAGAEFQEWFKEFSFGYNEKNQTQRLLWAFSYEG